MNFGQAIKEIRKRKGMTQKELALKCDISVTALSQIETNDSLPQKSTLKSISSALEVPNTYLFYLSLERDDVPEGKRVIYDTINTLMTNLLLDDVKIQE